MKKVLVMVFAALLLAGCAKKEGDGVYVELTLDNGLIAILAYDAGVDTIAENGPEGADKDRFACSCFSGKDVTRRRTCRNSLCR